MQFDQDLSNGNSSSAAGDWGGHSGEVDCPVLLSAHTDAAIDSYSGVQTCEAAAKGHNLLLLCLSPTTNLHTAPEI